MHLMIWKLLYQAQQQCSSTHMYRLPPTLLSAMALKSVPTGWKSGCSSLEDATWSDVPLRMGLWTGMVWAAFAR
jgi:hypothetical protein